MQPDLTTLYSIFLVQMAGAACFAVLLGRFYRTYERLYLREWARSWAALCIYVLGAFLGVAGMRDLAVQHPIRLVMTVVTLTAGYWQIAWLLFGTYAVAKRQSVSPRTSARILGVVFVGAVVLAVLFTGDPNAGGQRYFLRVGLRSLVAGIAYLTAGAWLARDRGWQQGAGRSIVIAAFAIYGLEQLNYFTTNLIELLGFYSFGPGLVLFGFFDFFIQFGMGLGMVIWLMETERDELVRTSKALQRSEQRLRQSQRLEVVGQLAGGVAHDFNNLLTVILGRSQLLLQRMGASSADRAEVQQIDEAAERGAILVRQLLAFSRQQVLAPRSVNLNDVVRNVQTMLQRSIGEQVLIECRLEEALGWTRVDPAQLEQVLVNLVFNARDAMPTGGTVTIETSNIDNALEEADSIAGDGSGGHVVLTVTDTGVGMDEETRKRVFEPFYTTKEFGKGSGLGLATAYGMINQSGGTITVDSAEGRGTIVRICLPQSAAAEETSIDTAAPEPIPFTADQEVGGETVLVVEDEERIRGLLDTVLGDNGYRVLIATNGREALELAAQHDNQIDLLLTDVVMPRMGGAELADELQSTAPDLRVLFMSGYSEEILARQLITGSRVLLEKPFTIVQLLDTVRSTLARAPGLS